MKMQQAIQHAFVQLTTTLQQLTDEQYSQPSEVLFNATIGQHVRHIIELFIELDKGYESGVVNYEKRKRDFVIETDKAFACTLLQQIYTGINKPDKQLLLQANYNEDTEGTMDIPTNYNREVVYNLEHTVHHMALIRVGVNEVAALRVPDSFGVASSTIKYHKACAQ